MPNCFFRDTETEQDLKQDLKKEHIYSSGKNQANIYVILSPIKTLLKNTAKIFSINLYITIDSMHINKT